MRAGERDHIYAHPRSVAAVADTSALFFHHETDRTPLAVSASGDMFSEPSRTLGDRWAVGRAFGQTAAAAGGAPAGPARRLAAAPPELLVTLSLGAAPETVVLVQARVAGTRVGFLPPHAAARTNGHNLSYPLCPASREVVLGRGLLGIDLRPVGAAAGSAAADDPAEAVQVRTALLDSRKYGAGTYMLYAGARTVVCLEIGPGGHLEGGHIQITSVPHAIRYRHSLTARPRAFDVGTAAWPRALVSAVVGVAVAAADDDDDGATPFIASTLPVFRSNATSLLETAGRELRLAEEKLVAFENAATAADRSLAQWREAELARGDEPASAGEETGEAATAVAAHERLDRHLAAADAARAEASTQLKAAQAALKRWTANAKRYAAARTRQRRLNRARGIAGITIPQLDKAGFTAVFAQFAALRARHKTAKARRAALRAAEEKVARERADALRRRRGDARAAAAAEGEAAARAAAEGEAAARAAAEEAAHAAAAGGGRADRGQAANDEMERLRRDLERTRDEGRRDLERARDEARRASERPAPQPLVLPAPGAAPTFVMPPPLPQNGGGGAPDAYAAALRESEWGRERARLEDALRAERDARRGEKDAALARAEEACMRRLEELQRRVDELQRAAAGGPPAPPGPPLAALRLADLVAAGSDAEALDLVRRARQRGVPLVLDVKPPAAGAT